MDHSSLGRLVCDKPAALERSVPGLWPCQPAMSLSATAVMSKEASEFGERIRIGV
jgi:hypothetical protein